MGSNDEADFLAGLEVLRPFFEEYDFDLRAQPPRENDAGTAYSAQFVWGNHRVTLVHRAVLRSVTYTIGTTSLEHASYLEALGVRQDAAFPPKSDDPAAGYVALLSDLHSRMMPFFEEPDREFMELADAARQRDAGKAGSGVPPVIVRAERGSDIEAIRRVNIEAFKTHEHSQQTEHLIVEALRAADALEVSLVAEEADEVVGHVAFSQAHIGKVTSGWYLLGPLAVLPEHQRRGIGSVLVKEGLSAIRSLGASGCVLVGDPEFYGRFGFVHTPGVTCAGVPDEYVLALCMSGPQPIGEIWHHPAFSVTAE